MKRIATFSILVLISGAFLISPATGDVVSGTICPKVGKTNVKDGLKYFCVKRGDKTVWGAGLKVALPVRPKPVEPVVPKALYLEPSIPSTNIETCKTKEVSGPRGLYDNSLPTGFPNSKTEFATKNGTMKWALIPVDFPDLAGEAEFMSRIQDQMRLLSDWYFSVSEGKLKIEWVVLDKWVRMLKPSTEYTIGNSNNVDRVPNGPKLFTDAMTRSDEVFDFTGVQTVNFILPNGQTFLKETSQGFPWDAVVKNLITSEGKVSSYSIAGVFMDDPGRAYWSYWAHEFGHAIGIPHIGGSRGTGAAFGVLDLMGNQDGPSRELSGWLRFISGWLDDSRVYCQEFSNLVSTEVSLVPLGSTDTGYKMSVVALSPSRALILESRRATKFSCKTPSLRNGVLAYIYDAKLGHGEDFLIPVTIPGRQMEGSSCTAPQSVDNLLRAGDKISVEGVTIEVLSHNEFDRLRISKAG